MSDNNRSICGYVFVALVGAVCGAVAITAAKKAQPKLMAKMQEHCHEMCMGGGEAEGEQASTSCCGERAAA